MGFGIAAVFNTDWPEWVAMVVAVVLTALLTLVLLPVVKAVILGVIWVARSPESVRD
jgi:uncharacterized protein (DUF983 family)